MKSMILLTVLLVSNISIAEYEFCGDAFAVAQVNKTIPINQTCVPAQANAESKAKADCFFKAINECKMLYGAECNWTVPTFDGPLPSSCTPSSSLNFLNIYAAHVCDVDCYKLVADDPDGSGN